MLLVLVSDVVAFVIHPSLRLHPASLWAVIVGELEEWWREGRWQ
jgi:hypothetical protein